MSKPQGTCVFCGQLGVSDEHMFGYWMGKLFPDVKPVKSSPQGLSAVTFNPNTGFGRPVKASREVRGHPIGRRVRRPCKSCNNGWMSQIEEAASRAMKPLILGEAPELTVAEQRAIATWAFLKAIIGEYTEDLTRCIPDADRTYVFQAHEPPPNYRIHLGITAVRHVGPGYLHRFIAPENSHELPRPIPDSIQSTAIKAGFLLVFVLGPCDERADELHFDDLPFMKIWPSGNRTQRPRVLNPWLVEDIASRTLGIVRLPGGLVQYDV